MCTPRHSLRGRALLRGKPAVTQAHTINGKRLCPPIPQILPKELEKRKTEARMRQEYFLKSKMNLQIKMRMKLIEWIARKYFRKLIDVKSISL